MPVVDKIVAPATCHMSICGYGSRIALAEPVIGRAFARPVGSLVRDDGDRFDFQTANPEAVIARSEATKQSILPLRGEMDCFASLAMTLNSRYDSAFSRRDASELCKTMSLDKQRAQGMPGAQCTRSLVCSV